MPPPPPPLPPVDENVIVSAVAFVDIVIPLPATNVNVSEGVSATTFDWPNIAIVVNEFDAVVLPPPLPPPLPVPSTA